MTESSLACSVVIPVFNRADLLRKVLMGLAGQRCLDTIFEVLVCDDGSIEALEPTIEEVRPHLPGIRFLRQINKGPASARNLGILQARSEVIVFLDSDVIPGKNVVQALTGALQTHPDWVGAEARLEPTGGADSILWDAPKSLHGGQYHTAGIAYRRELLLREGGLDENFPRAACEDVDLAVRMLRHGKIGFVHDAVVYHPRRRRTIASCWSARRNWASVQLLALRHGFLAWPDHPTRFPRMRTAWCAAVTLPAGKMLAALRHTRRAPREGLQGICLAIVDWIGGAAMLPVILFAQLPLRKSCLQTREPPHLGTLNE